jgi:alpha-L-arabinofuranosidase
VVKVVNAQDTDARTRIDLGRRVRVSPTARVTTIQGEPDDVNTAESRPIQARESRLRGIGSSFSYTFPANSVTFIRIKASTGKP